MQRLWPRLGYSLVALLLAGCGSDDGLSAGLRGPSRIAFVSSRHGGPQAYVIAPDGTGLTRISYTTGPVYSPNWSPDGDLLSFTGTDYYGDLGSDIYVVAPDGTGHVNLTKTPDVADFEADWSPDGTKVAFVTSRPEDSEIYVMRANGTALQRLTTDPLKNYRPLWSPDGNWIAFTSGPTDTTDLYVMGSDGSNPRRLTRSRIPEYDPEWSPDGTGIAFAGGTIDTLQIFVVDLNGNETRLTDNPQGAREPSWSHDGKRIVYSSGDGIHVMDRDGSNDYLVPGTSRYDRYPVWSGDGRAIAMENRYPNQYEVFIMAPDGSDRRSLSQSPSSDTSPAWEPLYGGSLK